MSSLAENARELLMQAAMPELKGMVQAIDDFVDAKVEVATHLLGEFHMGTDAITGTAANIQDLTLQLRSKVDLFEFTISNVAQQIMSGGGGK